MSQLEPRLSLEVRVRLELGLEEARVKLELGLDEAMVRLESGLEDARVRVELGLEEARMKLELGLEDVRVRLELGLEEERRWAIHATECWGGGGLVWWGSIWLFRMWEISLAMLSSLSLICFHMPR